MNCNVAAGRSVLGQPRHLLFAVGLAVASLVYVYARQSQRATVPDHGDAWADMLHLVAADKFNRYGYARLCFGLTLDDGAEIGLQPSYFPHWRAATCASGRCWSDTPASTSSTCRRPWSR